MLKIKKSINQNRKILIAGLVATIALTILFIFSFRAVLESRTPIYTEGLLGQPEDYTNMLQGLLYASLADLTQEVKIENEGKDYIFKLKDQQWSSGEPISANNILYNLERAPEFSQLEKEIIDKRTVKILLTQPFAPLQALTEKLYIFPSENSTNLLQKKTSGKYQIKNIVSEENRVTEIHLECRETYNCKLEELKLRFYANSGNRLTAAKLGEITAFRGASNLENWKEITAPVRGRYYALFFNLRKEKLQNLDLRTHIAQKTPYTKIVSLLTSPSGVTAGSPLDFTWASENSNKPGHTYNPELVKEHNTELTIAVPNNRPQHMQIAEIVRDEWVDLGISLKIKQFELNSLAEDILRTNNFDILLLGHEVGRDPDRYAWWHSTQAEFPGLNFSGYKNMRADRALEEGRKTVDKEKRTEHYKNFEELLLEEVPAIFLYHPILTLNIKDGTPQPDLSDMWLPEERLGY